MTGIPEIQTSGEETSYTRRSSAFGVIEYALYAYAVGKFVSDVAGAPLSRDGRIVAGVLLLACCFLFVVVRNYAVMQSIDRDERSPSESYKFVEIQGCVISGFERTIRLFIIAVVVLAPRNSYGQISDIMATIMLSIASGVEKVFGALFSTMGWMDSHYTDSNFTEYHGALSYYGAVLFFLSLLFIAWDVTGYVSYKWRTKISGLGVDISKQEVADAVYASWLMYINSYKVRSLGDGKYRKYFSIPWHTGTAEKHLLAGNAGKLYIRSWKMLERALLTITSLSILCCALTNMSPIAIGATFLLFGFYVVCAAQNQRYFRDFWRSVFYPYWYWVRRRPSGPIGDPEVRAHG